jgi:hypothetical protein
MGFVYCNRSDIHGAARRFEFGLNESLRRDEQETSWAESEIVHYALNLFSAQPRREGGSVNAPALQPLGKA